MQYIVVFWFVGKQMALSEIENKTFIENKKRAEQQETYSYFSFSYSSLQFFLKRILRNESYRNYVYRN